MHDLAFRFFEYPGKIILRILTALGEITLLCLEIFYWIFRGRILTRNLLDTLYLVGVESLPIVTFTALFSGMVLVVQVGNQFMQLGAESFIGGVVGLSLTRELSPLMVGTILAARMGSSMAAELGTMKVTEQIDALNVMATNPISYLVVPRVLACSLFTPILVIYSILVGTLGGLVVATTQIDCNFTLFMESLTSMVSGHDVVSGLFKSIGFGFLVALIGCYKGMNTEGGAKGVGSATTQSVVMIITSILVCNYFFSLVFFAWLKLRGEL